MVKKSKHTSNSNQRCSGRFSRDVPAYQSNRSTNRTQAHSMYWMSSIANYIPLSANVRQSNQSDQFDGCQKHHEEVINNSPRELRKKRGINEDINVKIAYQNCTKAESEFFDCILPLIQGGPMYKKFNTTTLLQQKVFDPLNAEDMSPDMWGYGIRNIRLDPSLKYIEIRQHLKSNIEQLIKVEDIVKTIVPQTTIDIVKSQSAHFGLQETSRAAQQKIFEDYSIFHLNGNISNLVKAGIINKKSDLYKQKCIVAQHFPFSVVLTCGDNLR